MTAHAESQIESESGPMARAAVIAATRGGEYLKGLARYRLTWLFVVISAVTFVAAALTISRIAERSAENNVVSLIQDQSTKDAMVIAGVVSRAVAGDSGATSQAGEFDPASAGRQVSEFLSASSIFRLALYEPGGRRIWVSNLRDWDASSEQRELFGTALDGEIASGLLRKQLIRNPAAMPKSLDVVETYIPFVSSGSRSPVLVLGISRDVTETLAVQMGQMRSVMSRSILLTMSAGFAVLLLFIVGADIAIWRSKEKALRQERDLARQRLALEQLDIQNRELERANAERARFVSMVSHELKTPLTSIIAFADILLKNGLQKDPAQTRKFLEIIKRNGGQFHGLVSDLLDVSKLDSGNLQLQPADFSLMTMLSEVRESMGAILESKKQVLLLDVQAGASYIRADRARLAQVIRNLVSNASKYSPGDSAVEVQAALVEGVLAIEVRDHGIGISPKDQESLFTPFFRADNETTRSVPGTGLGLVIVKAIIEAHGGAVSVKSEPGQGTTVSFRIPAHVAPGVPRARPVAPAEAPAPEKDEARPGPRFRWSGPRQWSETRCRPRWQSAHGSPRRRHRLAGLR
ncbi:MAG: HAMP domain-containing histidine kinase [Chloroflexi bacterium]|nr:HAMP domain-containing histidine kinase [Chloroflexota bacterium]